MRGQSPALIRAPAEGVSDAGGHTSPGAAGVYEGAEPPVLKGTAPLPKGAVQVYKTNLTNGLESLRCP